MNVIGSIASDKELAESIADDTARAIALQDQEGTFSERYPEICVISNND